MAIYAIGDLHLSFTSNKPMDIFGENWSNHADKLKLGFDELNPDDVCVICGDISWGMNLDECLEDFRFLDAFPGKKLLIKGNHDYWWDTVTKMKLFFDKHDLKSFNILHNNSFVFDDIAICGTRGWLIEDDSNPEHYSKIVAREAARLRTSLSMAGDSCEKLCFFHYPPRFKNLVCSEIVDVMYEFGVKHCWYGHIHGSGHNYAVCGNVDGISFNMVSADYINFTPKKVCINN